MSRTPRSHRRSRRSAVAAVATLACLSLLTACGGGADAGELAEGDWDAIVDAAHEEGSLRFYTGASEEQAKRLIAAFNEEYPDIEVKVERGGAEIVGRVEAQITSDLDGADVFMHADPAWYRAHEDDLVEYEGPEGDDLREGAWVLQDKAAVVHGSPYSMFVWNTDIFPKGFDDWEDFLAPSTKGKVGMRSDASKSSAGFMDFVETTQGADYMKKVGALKPKLYPSVVPIAQAVAAGEVGASMASMPSVVFDLQKQGAPLDFAYPDEAYGIEFTAAALETSRRPNAAVVFHDFMLSPEGQEALNGDGYGVAARADVEGALDPEGWTWSDTDKFTPEVMADWERKISSYFK